MSEMERRLDELEFALAAWVRNPRSDRLWRMLLDHVDDRELRRAPNPVTQRNPPPAGGG